MMEHTVHLGSLFHVLPQLSAQSVDAVITSPPYAEQRKQQYGGVPEQDYPAWTVQWMAEIQRVLVNGGNVAMVIRPHVAQGAISDYVLRTRLAIRAAGWYEIDELMWIKPTAPPLGNIARPRRSWESILWFSNTRKPYCDPLANGAASTRLGLDSTKGMNDYLHDKQARDVATGLARCRDYIAVPTHECDKGNGHPAQYPERLARWLIRLLCPLGGVVIDPFLGSGTTLVAARREQRSGVGIEIDPNYASMAEQRLREQVSLADELFQFF